MKFLIAAAARRGTHLAKSASSSALRAWGLHARCERSVETEVTQRIKAMPGDFEPEQKRYLEGLMTGLQIARTLRPANGNGAAPGVAPASNAAAPAGEPIGPDAAALRAQDRVLKAGGKLSDQEKFKRD